MPDSGPQVEDGYTRYANELLEALCKLKCRNHDRRLIDAVARLTYGIYGRKSAKIENSQLADMCGLSEQKVCDARARLVARNILKVTARGNVRLLTYSINKHYRTWKNYPLAGKPPAERSSLPAQGKDLPAEGNPTLLKENKKKTQKKDGAEKKPRTPPPPYKKIVEYLNALAGTDFKHQSETTRGQIRARFRTGYTEQDFYDVIKVKVDQWLGDPKMTSYLRPDTLFRPTKFEGYVQEARRTKQLGLSEKKKAEERRFKIAAAILRDEGQENCLAYCQANRVDPEKLKAWMANQTDKELLDGS